MMLKGLGATLAPKMCANSRPSRSRSPGYYAAERTVSY